MSGANLSLNYDRVLKQIGSLTMDLNVGFSYMQGRMGWNSLLGVPVYLSFASGHKNHHFEFGLGVTYNSGMNQSAHRSDSSFEVSGTSSSQALFGCFRLGYKYQKPGGGLYLRAGLTPLVLLKSFSNSIIGREFDPFFGLGAGYTF